MIDREVRYFCNAYLPQNSPSFLPSRLDNFDIMKTFVTLQAFIVSLLLFSVKSL